METVQQVNVCNSNLMEINCQYNCFKGASEREEGGLLAGGGPGGVKRTWDN
jgi:hypothetical protein